MSRTRKHRTLAFTILALSAACDSAIADRLPRAQIQADAGTVMRPIAETVHDLDIRRHILVEITTAEVDEILGVASDLLAARDGNDDVPADARLRRLGALGTVAAGTGTVRSRADFDALFSPQAGGVRQVRIVSRIEWCDGPPQPGMQIAGCADLTGYRILVVRAGRGLEPLIWAHEFGHTKGLPDTRAAGAVMNGTVAPGNRKLAAGEALSFQNISVATPVSGRLVQ